MPIGVGIDAIDRRRERYIEIAAMQAAHADPLAGEGEPDEALLREHANYVPEPNPRTIIDTVERFNQVMNVHAPPVPRRRPASNPISLRERARDCAFAWIMKWRGRR